MEMNLKDLFEVQRKLDAEIEKKHPVVQGEDRLAKRILALQVELGECANEWRGFKFWSKNQKPNTYSINPIFGTEEDGTPYQSHEETNPLLEEYVDCLHFVLSIGNSLKIKPEKLEQHTKPKRMPDLVDQFMWVNKKLVDLYEDNRDMNLEASEYYYLCLFNAMLGLGEMLGFTWEQIEAAYMSKNATNWERQANGY